MPGPDERQRHLPERPRRVRAEVARRLVDVVVVAVPDRDHDEEAERDAPDRVRARAPCARATSSWPIVFQKICVPRPSRKPGVISASRIT